MSPRTLLVFIALLALAWFALALLEDGLWLAVIYKWL